jgi:hypothetical protein
MVLEEPREHAEADADSSANRREHRDDEEG